MRGVLNAGGFIAESQGIADGLSSLSGSSQSCETVSFECASDATDCLPSTTTECTTVEDEVSTDDLLEARQDLHDGLDDLIQLLSDEIFIDENLEAEDETHATFRIPASLFCSEDDSPTLVSPSSPDDGSGVTPAPLEPEAPTDDGDVECEEDYELLQPRLRLSSPRAGDIDVEILLTEEQRNPITLQLYHDRLGAELNLGELLETLEASGEELDGVSKLEGVVGVQLIRNAATDYSLSLNVVERVALVAGEADERVEVTVGTNSPSMELRLDGAAKTITGSYDWGALSLVAPLAAFMADEEYDEFGNPLPMKEYAGIVSALLGGINGSLRFDGNADSLLLEGLGLGDVSSTIEHDGNELLKLDVNPDDGRRFDLLIAAEGDGAATLTFSPTLDVRAKLGFAHIADQVDDLQRFLLDDEVRVWLEGEDPSVHVSEEAVSPLDATLHVESSTDPSSSVSVGPGMCLVAVDESDDEPATFASAFEAAVCE